VPYRAQDFVHCQLRWRARRPQLKRDPLGGALPPHKHSSANSFGMLNAPGAGRRAPGRTGERQLAAPHRPESATGRARRALPALPVAGRAASQGEVGRGSVGRAARSSTDDKRAV